LLLVIWMVDGGPSAHVAVHGAVAVVHGTDKLPRAPSACPCACPASRPANSRANASHVVARLGRPPEPFWKNFFFFRPCPVPGPAPDVLGVPGSSAFGAEEGRGLRGGRRPAALPGAVPAPAGLRRVLLAALVLAAAPAAPMPLRLPWPLAGAGPSSVWGCVDSVVMRVLPGNVLFGALRSCAQPRCSLLLNSLCRPPIRHSDGKLLGLRSGHLRASGTLRRNFAAAQTATIPGRMAPLLPCRPHPETPQEFPPAL
jgi:hypothetical protein